MLNQRQKAWRDTIHSAGWAGITTDALRGRQSASQTIRSLVARHLVFYICDHVQFSHKQDSGVGITWVEAGCMVGSFRYVSRETLVASLLPNRPDLVAGIEQKLPVRW